MAQYVTTVALGRWADRDNLNYKPANSRLEDGKRYNAFGVPISRAGDPAELRRPYKIEEAGNVAYVMYDDDTNDVVPIFKTAEM